MVAPLCRFGVRTSGGSASAVSTSPSASSTLRSMTLRSSRTLPGHGYC
jgi:hypothetical protein